MTNCIESGKVFLRQDQLIREMDRISLIMIITIRVIIMIKMET